MFTLLEKLFFYFLLPFNIICMYYFWPDFGVAYISLLVVSAVAYVSYLWSVRPSQLIWKKNKQIN